MAAPTSTLVYPANNDTGIPVGIDIEITFDRGVDLQTIKDNVVLYGADSDQTSGPDTALWIDGDTGNNPYFLTSPGFKGVVPFTVALQYIDLDSDAVVTPVITSEADELAYGVAGAGHKVVITPTDQLSADLQYTLYVNGDPDTLGTIGVSSRTVFDLVDDVGNTSTTGVVANYGSWEGSVADTVVIEITTSGDIGDAKYRWYYQSAGVGSAVTGKVTSRRYRRLADGLQINFSGSGFVAGDLYTFGVEPLERMAASFKVVFTTNDGSYTAAPTSPSTPAASTPPATVLPPGAGGSATADELLYVVEMDPVNDSYHVDLDTRTITITFSEAIDPATITQTSVRLWKMPVLGVFEGTAVPVEIQKVLTLNSTTLVIEF